MRSIANTALLLIFTLAMLSCSKTATNLSDTSPASSAKRYHLKGKVVSIDTQAKMAIIDAEAIPDFMGAMTMPYTVKPESELQKLKPGEAITADVVLQNDSYWLENIVIVEDPGERK